MGGLVVPTITRQQTMSADRCTHQELEAHASTAEHVALKERDM